MKVIAINNYPYIFKRYSEETSLLVPDKHSEDIDIYPASSDTLVTSETPCFIGRYYYNDTESEAKSHIVLACKFDMLILTSDEANTLLIGSTIVRFETTYKGLLVQIDPSKESVFGIEFKHQFYKETIISTLSDHSINILQDLAGRRLITNHHTSLISRKPECTKASRVIHEILNLNRRLVQTSEDFINTIPGFKRSSEVSLKYPNYKRKEDFETEQRYELANGCNSAAEQGTYSRLELTKDYEDIDFSKLLALK